MTTTPTSGAADLRDTLINIAREIEALKRECGMDPESPIAIQNGRYMALSYKVRALAAGQATAAKQAPECPSMPETWHVVAHVRGEPILSIGCDWLSGKGELTEAETQAVIGMAQHLLAFVGYGLPPSSFDPDADDVATAQPAEAQQPGAAGLIGALEDAQRAINSMKVEAETAAQGDEQMMLEACETISNEGLQADMAIRAALAPNGQAAAAQQPKRSGCTAGTDEECTQRGCGTNCPAVSPHPDAAYAAPQFPDHPEPMVMDWSAIEISAIAQYGRDMYEAGKRAPAAPQQAAPAAERRYINGVKTVVDLVNNLLLLDQSLPIYAAQHIQIANRRRTITVPPTVSRERVKDERWIGEGDKLNAAIIWTRAEAPEQAAPAGTQMEPIAEVIEELENDGTGWCAKVRWLYNPVPVGEQLYWPQPAPVAVAGPSDPSITLDFKQATELLKMFGGESGLVTLQHGNERSHSGAGLYAWYSDLPEDGAAFLGAEPHDEATPTPQQAPQQEAQEPFAWHVCSVNSDGSLSLEHAAAWEEAAHEHINDAITEHDIEGAGSWVVRPAYHAPQPSPAAQGDALDAARYRWLKANVSSGSLGTEDGSWLDDNTAEWDGAIDAAQEGKAA